MKIYGFVLCFIAFIFLSLHGVGIRYLETDLGLSFGLVAFSRFLLGSLLLFFLIPIFTKKGDFKKILSPKCGIIKDKIFWITGLFFFGTVISLHYGLKYTSASNSILIETLFPVIVAIIAMSYYPNQKYKYSYRVIFFLVIFSSVGTSLLMSDNSFVTGNSNYKLFGDFFAFISMIFLAFFNFFNVELRRKYNDYNGVLITIMFFLIGFLLSLPFLLLNFNSIFDIPKKGWLFISLIGFGSTGISYLCLFYAARYINAITIALLFNIIGVTTVLFEYHIYGNTLNPPTIKLFLGGIIIILSAIYINYLTIEQKKN